MASLGARLRASGARPKLASREKSPDQGEGVFVIRAQARTAPREKALRYDGPASGDTVNTYTWNARNQLTAITQGSTTQMSYAYDALGRRITKAVQGGTPTQFLYDGANAVQETVGSTINPILIGPGIDERYARNDVTGRTYFLSDALNSTVALTSSTGAIQNQYSYDPYGNTTASNATFTNPYQYTGREADTPGLYYYRARYYSPGTGGFISEDPAGFGGGQLSFYAGFGGDPLDRIDPFGLEWQASVGFNVTAAFLFWGGGASANIGITSNGNIFFQFQGDAEGGLGAYLGAGFVGGISHTKCDSTPGWSKSTGAIIEADGGYGPSAGGNLAYNGGQDVGGGTGLGKLGVGGGIWAGAGVNRAYTYTTPTFSQMWNSFSNRW